MFDCRAYIHIPKDERSKLYDKVKECIFLGYMHEEFEYRLWDPVTRKFIKNRDVVFLEDYLVDDAEKINESQSSSEIPIILTSVSPPVIHDDHRGAEKNNNDGPAEPIEQAPLELPTPPVELELRRSTRERRLSTRHPPHEYVMLTDEGEPKCFEKAMSH